MKKLVLLIVSAMLAGPLCHAQTADDYKNFIKERKAMASFTREQMKAKVDKYVKKEAKKLEKEGWLVAPGALPIERQLDRVYKMKNDLDINTGLPKYVTGESTTVGENYNAAKMQATAVAKIHLASNIQTEVVALVETRMGNSELSQDQAASVSESVQGAKNMISQSIGRTITGMEVYQKLPNGNYKVRVELLYNGEMAMAAAKKAIREDMENKADKLVEQLDKILGF